MSARLGSFTSKGKLGSARVRLGDQKSRLGLVEPSRAPSLARFSSARWQHWAQPYYFCVCSGLYHDCRRSQNINFYRWAFPEGQIYWFFNLRIVFNTQEKATEIGRRKLTRVRRMNYLSESGVLGVRRGETVRGVQGKNRV